jgi:hypothetical protein
MSDTAITGKALLVFIVFVLSFICSV